MNCEDELNISDVYEDVVCAWLKITKNSPPYLHIQHVLLSHPSAFSVILQFSLPPTPHISNTDAKEVSLITLSMCTEVIVCSICAHLKAHICLSVWVSTSLPPPFYTEAPRVWFSLVNKAPTVSQTCWGVHMKSVNGSIFPLLYGHNKTLNTRDQKTDSTAASLVLDEWNRTTLS